MKIGVICEGRSDFPAIVHFFRNALRANGVEPQFTPLFPKMDETRPAAGWPNVLLWLDENRPAARIQRYFRGGLFGGGLKTDSIDAIIIHLDADVLGDESFCNFVESRYGFRPDAPDAIPERGGEIHRVLNIARGDDEMTEGDVARHVNAVAVEATETWCVAVFHSQAGQWEALRGEDLRNQFMRALEISESREPQDSYEKTDKSYARRSRYCEKYEAFSDRVSNSCTHFQAAQAKLLDLAT